MLGGMFAVTVADGFGLRQAPPTLWPLVVAVLLVSMACCAGINATIEFVAYRPLRNAPRLAPLITAIGMSFIVEDVGFIWKGPNYVNFPNVLPIEPLLRSAAWRSTWTTPIVVSHRSRAGRPALARAADKAGQGDACDRPGHGGERDHGYRRQPDDLVHVPDRGSARGSRGPRLRTCETTVRYDQGFTLG